MTKPRLVMCIGLPGSGKSTWAAKYVANTPNTIVVSSDAIREELYGDANCQKNPDAVFSIMNQRAAWALQEGTNVVYDATNLVAKNRKATLAQLREQADFIAMAIFCACSLSECKRRQDMRDRKVPNEVIDRMVRQFETPWFNEGWDKIHRVMCGPTQNLEKEHRRLMSTLHDNPHHSDTSINNHCTEVYCGMRRILEDKKLGLSTRRILTEAAYQHDLGKYKTKAFIDSKGKSCDIAHYYSHHNVGAYLWLTGDTFFDWEEDEAWSIALLIQWHMQPYFISADCREVEGQNKVFDWCKKRGFDTLFARNLCWLNIADREGH